MKSSHEGFISGFIAIIGSPNVGKSTLMNHIVGMKVAIVSKKPQTTRNKIVGILNGIGFQMIFLDTPGVHNPKNKLGEYMVKTAYDSTRDVESILFVLDAKRGVGNRDREILKKLKKGGLPLIIAVNKIDLVKKEVLIRISDELRELEIEEGVFLISAKLGDGVDELVAALITKLVPGPMYYPEDMVTDQPERMIAAEMIREKALELLKEEVPHGIGVEIEKISKRQDKEIVDVSAIIYCEKDSHKGIIIGKGGKMLKKIGIESRSDIEMLFGIKVFLQVWVKVKNSWRDSDFILKTLGYK